MGLFSSLLKIEESEQMTRFASILLGGALVSAAAAAEGLQCDFSQYKSQQGLTAEPSSRGLSITWAGERGQQLRAVFGQSGAQPVIEELAARKNGSWTVLGTGLIPELEITSGKRRISNQQLQPLRALGRQITPELIEKEKWNAFWDAPLEVPGSQNTNPGLPRKPDEIRKALASFKVNGCSVKTNGARLEITFGDMEAGIFSGHLVYTVYKDQTCCGRRR
jgi:hypothetical protein